MDTPKTLLEAIRYFSDPDTCLNYMVSRRWPDGATCPHCGSKDAHFIRSRRIWRCRGCQKQYSVKVGTIFEDSPLGLDKWLAGVWLITNAKNGISSCEIARALGVTQKSAWFLLHRIRLAMRQGTIEKLSGTVEADETFIGGLARNMHTSDRKRKITGRGVSGKEVVMGLLERHGNDGKKKSRVVAKHVGDRSRETLHGQVREVVEPGSALYSDEFGGYSGIDAEYAHEVINHAEEYVNGIVHTNGMENFWSLLKRGLKGTYISVEPWHLFRYIDEQAFRFNERADEKGDAGRFEKVASNMAGKRLTYKQVTGWDKWEESPAT
jgi:transposase-like protein